MKKKKIAVIFGGCSSEYGVSLQSAYSVITNLDENKYELTLIGITKEGKWFLYEGDVKNLLDDTWQRGNCIEAIISPSRDHKGILVFGGTENYTIEIDMAFPVLHGQNGEDGTIQGLLELAGIPIIGCGLGSSYICMDKVIAHKIAAEGGIRVPACVVINKGEEISDFMADIENLGYPLFVKPVKAGSSYGITKVHDKSQIIKAIEDAFFYDSQIIAEENIDGFEVGCAVFGNNELQISPVDEIELFVDWFDFHEKYTQKKSKIHLPARINENLANQIREMSGQLYKIFGCKGFARVDIFLNSKNELIFNEINTIPGMTTHSRYPNMVKGMGITYAELMDKFVELAEK